MKIPELRERIRNYGREQLERVLVEVYRAIPKRVTDEKGIDFLILNPDAKPAPKQPTCREMDDIAFEAEEFISDAYNQYYFAPNSVVPKRERPKWRFIARRLFKELNLAAAQPEDTAEAAELLAQLYKLLCYSCGYILFSAYDPFVSVGISQTEFFRAVLNAKRKAEPPREFVRNSIMLALANSLNRYTLHEDLLKEVETFLKTADLKMSAIEACGELRKEVSSGKPGNPRLGKDVFTDYNKRKFLQNLAIAGCRLHLALGQTREAADYFYRHYKEEDKEITLYVLLRTIEDGGHWNLWLKTYDEAVAIGIQPRENLRQRRELVLNQHHNPK